MMDERIKLFVLHHAEGVGNRTLGKLMSNDIWSRDWSAMEAGDWMSCGLPAAQAARICQHVRTFSLSTVMGRYEQRHVQWLTVFDDQYPSWLRHTADPPAVLYALGNLSLLTQPAIAIVGTRNATVYGKKVARRFATQLAEAGFCIVSGMASGIDGQAHLGALDADGGTIAVLGSGVEYIYPPEHRGLYEQLSERGLLLSEYPFGTKPAPGLFPMRNRIIAGLSLGVLVVEAAVRSGSLITADLALEESREVFAIPGPISSPKSGGCLELLKQGAKLVTDVDDILQEFQNVWCNHHEEVTETNLQSAVEQSEQIKAELSSEEWKVYELMSGEPVSFDELLELVQYEFGQLHSVLLSLLLKKHILQHAGMAFSLNIK